MFASMHVWKHICSYFNYFEAKSMDSNIGECLQACTFGSAFVSIFEYFLEAKSMDSNIGECLQAVGF